MKTCIKTILTTKGEFLTHPIEIVLPEGAYDHDGNVSENIAFVQFVFSEKYDTADSIVVSDTPIDYSYRLSNDGMYNYYHIAIWKTNSDISGEGIYYDKTDGIVYTDGSGKTSALELSELYKCINESNSETNYCILDIFYKPVFSICKLSACLSDLQRKFIFEGQRNNGLVCEDEHSKLSRDFLFATIYILKDLIKQQRYEEADRIIQSINWCTPLCKFDSTYNYCGCR